MDEKAERIVDGFQHVIILALLSLMLVVISVAAIDLAILIVRSIVLPPYFTVLTLTEILDILSAFLMVLIAMELLETIRMYLEEDKVHVNVVLLVAIIAIARKVIILDVKHMEPMILFGIASIIIALCAGYYFLRRANAKQK